MPPILKCLFSLLLTEAAFFTAAAQEPAAHKTNFGSLVANQTGNEKTGILYRDWAANAREAGASLDAGEGIKGSFFFNEGWGKGFLLFEGDKSVKNITLSFNEATNEIYILKDSQALVLDGSLPVTEFGFYDQDDSLRVKTAFRCGYPAQAQGAGTPKTFYQVLVNGKISLLKLTGKKLLQINNSAGVPTKNIISTESWYVYDASGNTLTKIRHNKNSLEESLPAYTKAIQAILEEKKLKLKTETDWAILLNELNSKL